MTLPALLRGLLVNTGFRRTMNLLLGHATECRALMMTLPKDSEHYEEALQAAEMSQAIADRINLDSSLLLRVFGMELTPATFASISSIISTGVGLVLAEVNLGELQRKGLTGDLSNWTLCSV